MSAAPGPLPVTPRVLVMRAEPEAARTAARLVALGFAPIAAPLTRIVATAEPPPQGPFDAVLVTSARAAPFLAALPEEVRAKPFLAVGPASGEALVAAGIADVRAAGGDAGALAQLVRESLAPGARLLHVAGEDRKDEPGASLAASGYAIAAWSAYRAEPRALDAGIRAALAKDRLHGALHYSRRSAVLALEAVRAAGVEEGFVRLLHATISEDAAEPLGQAGVRRLHVAPEPSEAALLSTFADAASVAFGAR